jgi:hypothetical protein
MKIKNGKIIAQGGAGILAQGPALLDWPNGIVAHASRCGTCARRGHHAVATCVAARWRSPAAPAQHGRWREHDDG